MRALLDQDLCLTLKDLAQSINVEESTISKRLKPIGYIHKQGVTFIERRRRGKMWTYKIFLQRHEKKGVSQQIVTGDEKWIYFDNPRCTKVWAKLSKPHGQQLVSIANIASN